MEIYKKKVKKAKIKKLEFKFQQKVEYFLRL